MNKLRPIKEILYEIDVVKMAKKSRYQNNSGEVTGGENETMNSDDNTKSGRTND